MYAYYTATAHKFKSTDHFDAGFLLELVQRLGRLASKQPVKDKRDVFAKFRSERTYLLPGDERSGQNLAADFACSKTSKDS